MDLYDRCYARQAVVDNAVNRRSRELLQVIEKLRVAIQERISTLSTKIKEHKVSLDRMMLESQKWEGYQQSLLTLELKVTSLGMLSTDPFDFRVEGQHDLATATFPWLDEFVADPPAPIEALLSKKPSTLQRPAPSRTQVPFPCSQKATPSLVPDSNPMSPLADVFVVKPQSSQLQ
nr:hypothetical protein [Tanacetum cinerariifolium]